MINRDEVIHFCEKIGADALLTQGPGGNVSWKDGDTLWVKASGTWLADAGTKDIFVPVDLTTLNQAIKAQNFKTAPRLISTTELRPSIETMLHALMSQPIVVHVHAVEILACLVREDSSALIDRIFSDRNDWCWVPYKKPGTELAEALYMALSGRPDARVAFLQNHGIVLGAPSTAEIEKTLFDLIARCKSELAAHLPNKSPSALLFPTNEQNTYQSLTDVEVQQLALNPELYSQLTSNWVLYPDHAVFLGPEAVCYDDINTFRSAHAALRTPPPSLAFVRGSGVYVTNKFNRAQYAQLRCYYEVLRRQSEKISLKPLSEKEVSALLTWDAEQYRKSLTT
jgi:rhamnose utilization protein RhaD (predicted bifunctional aldolase and dehydrogenase)